MPNLKKAAKRNGFKKPEPIPLGEILTDIHKRQWKIGPSIGTGGFGEIYSACENNSNVQLSKYPYVAKIEPHENGPLFVEMHFYMRNAKKDEITAFCKSHKLSKLGMPEYISSGSHILPNGNKYRFLIMHRFVSDIQCYFKKLGLFTDHTNLRLALQMTDVLEYIHSKKYVHADLKAANILLNSSMDQAYLVDFGLASHYNTDVFKPDPKKMHNGTIEYTSRDAHLGVATRRGDFEILVYNLIHWSGGTLPWDDKLSNPTSVQAEKEKSAKNVNQFLNSCFTKKEQPKYLLEFTKLVMNMKNNEEPNYSKIRAIFENSLKSSGKANKGKFDFITDNVDSKVISSKRHIKETSSPIISKEKLLKVAKKQLKASPSKASKKNDRSPSKQSPLAKNSSSKISALKKINSLDYSIYEHEELEIIVKKTNVITGEVKTTVRTEKSHTNYKSSNTVSGVRSSPRLNARSKRNIQDVEDSDDLNTSNEENIVSNKRINRSKITNKETNSKRMGSSTIKSNKSPKLLKKNKRTE